ncbi:hypothetical protein GCM10020256_15080 [Streptomyces thermocoprophilus]
MSYRRSRTPWNGRSNGRCARASSRATGRWRRRRWSCGGRIREAEQIRRHFGRTPPVEIAYDAYTADTAENRILRAAVERLLRLPGLPGDVRRRLAHQRVRLADASPLVRGQQLPRWQPSRLNARCVPALRLAEAVLRGSSPNTGRPAPNRSPWTASCST